MIMEKWRKCFFSELLKFLKDQEVIRNKELTHGTEKIGKVEIKSRERYALKASFKE